MSFEPYCNIPDRAGIQQRAEAEVPLDDVMQGWALGTDPVVHRAGTHGLLDSSAKVVSIHSGQRGQPEVLQFHRDRVLPSVRAADP